MQLEQAADDLPVLDGEDIESAENNQGGTATGTGSDDS